MKKPIDKEYLTNTLKSFDAEVSETKYLHKNDPSVHTHDNKTILDKISKSDKGTLLFDGKEVGNTESSSASMEYDILSTSSEVKENAVAGKLVDALVIKEVFQSVSDGKELLASAITDKGVDTDANDSFASMAEKIRSISCNEITIPLDVPTDVTLIGNITSVTLKWTDPDDVIYKDIALAKWAGTLIVRKAGSAPTSKSDGIVVADSKIRNQYKTTGLVDDKLEYGITYYYGIFPYTSNDTYNYEFTDSIELHSIYTDQDENWNYTLDTANNTITLNYYIGSETDVTVNENYIINGKIYKTQIASNTDDDNFTKYMFAKCTRIKSIIFDRNIDTSNVTNMSYMFYDCVSLTNLDLANFDTSNVTDMHGMFMLCGNAANTNLDLNLLKFNTTKVTNMSDMFNSCGIKKELDLNSFNTSKVIDMSGMFRECTATNIDLCSFDTSNVSDMSDMFYENIGLTSVDLSSFNTHNTKTMNAMFMGASNLKIIYVSQGNWSTSNADTTMMFKMCGTSSVTYK